MSKQGTRVAAGAAALLCLLLGHLSPGPATGAVLDTVNGGAAGQYANRAAVEATAALDLLALALAAYAAAPLARAIATRSGESLRHLLPALRSQGK